MQYRKNETGTRLWPFKQLKFINKINSSDPGMSDSRMYSGRVSPYPAKYQSPKAKKENHVDFSESSTTHGVYYAFERDVKPISHVFW